MQKGEKMNDLISRQAAIEDIRTMIPKDARLDIKWIEMWLMQLPSVQPERWEDERKKIADALSEKMAYMNTCLNERDVILGYLGVKRPNETHCNSDCRNEKCESYRYATKYATKELPSAQPEIIRCKDCKSYQFADNRAFGMPVKMCEWFGFEDVDDDDFCSRAEPYKGEQE